MKAEEIEAIEEEIGCEELARIQSYHNPEKALAFLKELQDGSEAEEGEPRIERVILVQGVKALRSGISVQAVVRCADSQLYVICGMRSVTYATRWEPADEDCELTYSRFS